jgi:hypothetical protein
MPGATPAPWLMRKCVGPRRQARDTGVARVSPLSDAAWAARLPAAGRAVGAPDLQSADCQRDFVRSRHPKATGELNLLKILHE